MTVRFTPRDRIIFWCTYVYYRSVGLLFEVRTPRLRFLAFELLSTMSKVLLRMSRVPYRFTMAYAETRFGRFWLRPWTLDSVCASPAFERTDVDRLLTLMKAHVSAAQRILFLDIGAGFGTYTVTVGNRFRRYEDLRIVSYEPAPETLRLLRANVSLNALDEKVRIIPYAVCADDEAVLTLDYDTNAPGSSGITSAERVGPGHKAISVQGVTIDASCGRDLVDVDVVFVKIDVEGHETEVVRGGRALFRAEVKTYLLVEDAIDDTIHTTLAEGNATFLGKISPYNSWWAH